jgi:serine/threonine-protein kinase RsbW
MRCVLKPDGPANSLSAVSTAGDNITLTFPATPDFLRLARLASADAGSRAGFDVEEIDDLRIAVSELCHLVSRADGSGAVSLTFTLLDDAVEVDGAGPGVPEGDIELSRTIIGAVVDNHELGGADGSGQFHLVKRRRDH